MDVPFRTMGIDISKANSVQEAIELSKLNFKVNTVPLFAHFNDDDYNRNIPINTHKATYREDSKDIFAVVGKRYEVVQNSEFFDFVQQLTDERDINWETAGYFGNGETVFISLKLPEKIRLAKYPTDVIDNYLLIYSSHDGSGSIKIVLTPVRLVCKNSLNAALSSKNVWTLKHTKNVRAKIELIKRLFINIEEELTQFVTKMNEYSNVSITESHIDKLIHKIVLNKTEYNIDKNGTLYLTKDITSRKENLIYNIKKSIYSGVGQDNINVQTLYGVFNGITTYVQNHKTFKNQEEKFKTLYMRNSIINKMATELDIYNELYKNPI